MTMSPPDAAWAAYRESIRGIFTVPAASLDADRGGGVGALDDEKLQERGGGEMLERAENLRRALADSLQTGGLAQRELAGLKLAAAAAYDLAVAGDLLELERANATGDADRSEGIVSSL